MKCGGQAIQLFGCNNLFTFTNYSSSKTGSLTYFRNLLVYDTHFFKNIKM